MGIFDFGSPEIALLVNALIFIGIAAFIVYCIRQGYRAYNKKNN